MLAACAFLSVAISCTSQNISNREGVAAHDVARARRDFDVDGTGVKVCVLSNSIRHLNEAKDISLKNVSVLSGQDGIRQDGNDTGEGTAMLEIIHSIAPGAELIFATSGGRNPQQMVNNIRALGNEGCRIIVDDKEFYDQSPFQDDTVSRAVNEVAAKGILYITSAGNRGNTKAGTSTAWEGSFRPGQVLKDQGGRTARTMHVFDDGQHGEYNDVLGDCGRKGGTLHVHLFWNDRLPYSDNSQPSDLSDYELWAVNETGVLKDEEGNYVTTARRKDERGNYVTTACLKGKDEKGRCADDMTAHTPGEKPCRHICFPAPNNTNSNRTSIVITKVSGKADGFLHLDIDATESSNKNGCRLEHATGGVISGHHGAERAFSVAAKSALGFDSALDSYGVFMGGPTEDVNVSSAEGPRLMFFAQNGIPYNPPRRLQKPDVTAADGVTTDVKGFEQFFGTSAAAPQVAGIAALMWSKDRNLTAEQIKKALQISAIQVGPNKGWNALSGFGIVNAVRALRAIETVKSDASREDSGRTDDFRRPRRVEQALESSVVRRRLVPLK
jgi:hypothetical protein